MSFYINHSTNGDPNLFLFLLSLEDGLKLCTNF